MKTLFILLLAFLMIFDTDSTVLYIDEAAQAVVFYCPPAESVKDRFEAGLLLDNDHFFLTTCASNICVSSPSWSVISNLTGFFMYRYMRATISDLIFVRKFQNIYCSYATVSLIQHDIFIIARPQNVSCSSPIIHNTDVSITCSASRIYPSAACNLYLTNIVTPLPVNISFSNNIYNDTVNYYQSNCTMTSSLSNYEAGNYSFFVVMYPNVTTDIKYGVNQSVHSMLQLSLPSVKLLDGCFNNTNIIDGYIRQNAVVQCVCYLDNVGFPPGNVTWLNSAGQSVGEFYNATAKTLIIDNSLDKMYTCASETSLKGKGNTIFYNITYAKGPSSCEVKHEINETLTMCNKTNVLLTISCQVNKTDVIPGFKAVFYVNNSMVSSVMERSTATYIMKKEIVITSPGLSLIVCHAINLKFGDMNATCGYFIQVSASPKSPTILVIDSNVIGSVGNVIEHKVYNFKCSVNDGIPPAENVTVSCGNLTNVTTPGNVLASPVMFSRNMTGLFCSCKAQHTSECYIDNTSIMQLNVLYAAVVKFFIKNQNVSVVNEGTVLDFVCGADGNPSPVMRIMKNSLLIHVIRDNYTISLTKNMSCTDTGIYACQVENGITTSNIQIRNLSISVLCAIQFNNSDIISSNFTLSMGKVLSINLEIFGYPWPSNFFIIKLDKTVNESSITAMLKVDEDEFISTDEKISVRYVSKVPPFGTLSMNISARTALDFTVYTLIIVQSGFKNLSYTLSIQEGKDFQTKSDVNIAAAIGGRLAFVVFIIFIVIAMVLIKRKHDKFSRNDAFNNESPRNNYSELSVLGNQEDKHIYEQASVRQDDLTLNTESNYVNIKENMDVKVSEDANTKNSPYCNIADVNPTQFKDENKFK